MATTTRKEIAVRSKSTIGRIFADAANARISLKYNATEALRYTASAITSLLPTTFSGAVTLSAGLRLAVNADVAATGSAQGDAAQLSEGLTIVTGADGTKGVLLPTAVAGMTVLVKGTTAGVLKIYPATGAAINAISANGALSLASGVIPVILVAKSATQWYTFPLVAS
jgi:hypothetical protein